MVKKSFVPNAKAVACACFLDTVIPFRTAHDGHGGTEIPEKTKELRALTGTVGREGLSFTQNP